MIISFNDAKRVLDYTNLSSKNVYPLMAHSNTPVVIKSLAQAENITPRTVEGDSIVTNCPDVILTMPTADCAPIVLHDAINNVMAILHCGWKPTISGIIENTVMEMKLLGAKTDNIKAIIGPHIQQESFEVRANMRDEIIKKSKYYEKLFHQINDEQWLFDLAILCESKLNELGITKVFHCGIDTYSNLNYHSYRRYTQNYGSDFCIGAKNGAYLNLNTAQLR